MTFLCWSIWPIARQPSWLMWASTVDISNSVNRWFRRSSSAADSGLWAGILLAIGLLWLGLYFWDRSRKPRTAAGQDSEGLFQQLSNLHQLSKADRELLKQVAKTQSLSQPGLLFIDPRPLLDYAEKSPGNSREIQSLLDRLFGSALVEAIVAGHAPSNVTV